MLENKKVSPRDLRQLDLKSTLNPGQNESKSNFGARFLPGYFPWTNNTFPQVDDPDEDLTPQMNNLMVGLEPNRRPSFIKKRMNEKKLWRTMAGLNDKTQQKQRLLRFVWYNTGSGGLGFNRFFYFSFSSFTSQICIYIFIRFIENKYHAHHFFEF